jgi:hypothetical protein
MKLLALCLLAAMVGGAAIYTTVVITVDFEVPQPADW